MNESQRIVVKWRSKLKSFGWPEDAIAEIVKALCEAGYRQALEDIRAQQARNEELIAKVVVN